MKNPDPEDEAFEQLALKQGHWQHTSGWRKKQIQEPSMTDKKLFKLALDALEYWDVHGKLHQPTEEAITALKKRLADPMRDVQRLGQEIEQERNFCPRCGKRSPDLITIHTCTPPPQERK